MLVIERVQFFASGKVLEEQFPTCCMEHSVAIVEKAVRQYREDGMLLDHKSVNVWLLSTQTDFQQFMLMSLETVKLPTLLGIAIQIVELKEEN